MKRWFVFGVLAVLAAAGVAQGAAPSLRVRVEVPGFVVHETYCDYDERMTTTEQRNGARSVTSLSVEVSSKFHKMNSQNPYVITGRIGSKFDKSKVETKIDTWCVEFPFVFRIPVNIHEQGKLVQKEATISISPLSEAVTGRKPAPNRFP